MQKSISFLIVWIVLAQDGMGPTPGQKLRAQTVIPADSFKRDRTQRREPEFAHSSGQGSRVSEQRFKYPIENQGFHRRDCSRFCSSLREVGWHKRRGVRPDAMRMGYVSHLCTLRARPGWRFLQTLRLPNKSMEANVAVTSVTGDSSEQVLVHKVQYQSGTGVNQENFVIYKLIDGKLVKVLNVVEHAWLTSPLDRLSGFPREQVCLCSTRSRF